MSKTRLNVFLSVSVTIVALAVILQGCKKAEEQQPASTPQTTPAEHAAARSQPSPPPLPVPAAPLPGIPSADAKQHIGETNTVCGVIAGTRYLERTASKPTLLNFDRPYPDHTCSVMIPDSSRGKFPEPPETLFKNKIVCVTGAIIDYRGKPEIIVEDPSQIVIQESAPPAAAATAPTANASATNVMEKPAETAPEP
jgi:hypothetical protein